MSLATEQRRFEVVVVGAGPAGLAAAAATTGAGLRTCLVDGGRDIGGQYWRGAAKDTARDRDLHHDLPRLEWLMAQLSAVTHTGLLTHVAAHQVWSLESGSQGHRLNLVRTDRAGESRATAIEGERLVLATGAHERQVPFPGWDLPGVISAGAAQALLKESGVAVGPRVVVAGTGPFLLPVAVGLARRGSRVVALLEANRLRGWLRRPGVVLGHPRKLAEGLGYAGALAARRIRVRPGWVVREVHGDDRLEAVTMVRTAPDGSFVPGTERRVRTDVLAVGWGFVPQTDLAEQAGCAVSSGPDGSAVVVVDGEQQATGSGVWAAGEVTGVGGAALAEAEGRIAGLATARDAGRPVRIPNRLLRSRDRARRFADAVHAASPVPTHWLGGLEPQTIVCRCEDVTVAELREAVELGARDTRSAKLLCRAGMGLCQGRQCGYAVRRLVAELAGLPEQPDLGARRPVVHPVPLGMVAESGPHRQVTPPE